MNRLSFTITHIHVILMTVGLIVGIILMKILSKRPPSETKPLWDQVINSNSDIVTLIGLIVGTVLIMTMIFSFQDDIKSEAGYIILSALNAFFYLAGVRKGEANGKSP